jgi:hypothetical protein
MNRKQLQLPISLVTLLIVALAVKSILLHGQPVIRLQHGPALVGIVSQSLGISGPNQALPVAGKDYELQNINYFDNKAWVVASIVSLNGANNQIIVMHMISGMYQTVLGPGSAFPDSYLQSLPPGVSQYLLNRGVMYESADN